jgi:hypothetical protein
MVWFSNLTFWIFISRANSVLGHLPSYKSDPTALELGLGTRLTDWALRFAFISIWIGFALLIDALLFNRDKLKRWDIVIFVVGIVWFLFTIYSKSFGWYLD